MTEHTGSRVIVVGVDGSKASRAALRWAVEQAHVLDTQVVAVHAWEPAAAFAPYAPVSERPTTAEQRERAAELLATTVRAAFGARVDPRVRALLVEGPPVRVLLQRARGALLLALGRAPHSQWELPAVGPVGRECLRRSAVPVVMVPASDPGEVPSETAQAPDRIRSGAA
ncbi:universal stress protein [Streptomyces cylindrosporus]|uniref:Universal stress protein n=1 Tax=Streptomyces cylindrosporus TaxID=2927583 RepID=A0ABS9YLT8_9ACTN|nr:universal stress protein [Streptomyces cylindrosporus]MCI3278227.1 universal stress protein [Streptomyces cylindrosporus]